MWKNAWGHLCTINHHKWIVMKLCFRIGYLKQGLLHDLSKYSWIEFKSGVKYFQGNKSPNSIEKERYGYSEAWIHHAGRNKHHFNYWMDITKGEVVSIRMPVNYVIEMFCDRISATMTYQKDAYTDNSALAYFMRYYDYIFMDQASMDLLQIMLEYLSQHGLDETIHFIRTTVKTKGYELLEE